MEIATIKEIVQFGIEELEDKKMEISLKDFAYIYKTIEELRRFFHNRDHYQNLEDVHKYLSGEDGMYKILSDIYSETFENMMSNEIESLMSDENLYTEKKPFYYYRK